MVDFYGKLVGKYIIIIHGSYMMELHMEFYMGRPLWMAENEGVSLGLFHPEIRGVVGPLLMPTIGARLV